MAGTVAAPLIERGLDPTIPADAAPTSRRPKRRGVGGVVVALLAALLLSGVLTSCETTASDRVAVVDAINRSRAQHGVPGVRQNAALNAKADAWARRMRDECRIWHSHLADGAPRGWRKLGENVGRGGSIAQVHGAYMGSPGHKRNILDRDFNHVGTAAVWGTCGGYRTVFTVHVFMKY